MQLLLGSDPEAFILNKKSGQYVAAFGILPGTKKEPLKVERGAVQVDGLAFEYNIEPAADAETFSKNHEVVQKQMVEMVKKVDKDFDVVFTPYVKFDVKYFKELPEEAKILGCDPDFNYMGQPKVIDESQAGNPIRTAAGHIHIGWTKDQDPTEPVHFEDCRFIAHHFHGRDLGRLANVCGYLNTHEENVRLNYYGGAGAFRPKPYGVELRSYSNIWVRKDAYRQKAFNYIKRSVEALYKG